MTRPEWYQLPFDFGSRNNRSSIYYEIGFGSVEQQPEGSSRFVRRLNEEVVVRSPYDAAQHLMDRVFVPIEAFDQEELWLLLINTKNRITHEAMVYRGTINTIYIRPAELFKEAVQVNAPALLLSYIHPSGDPSPSPEDVRVTEDAVQAGKLLGIDLLDHIGALCISSRKGAFRSLISGSDQDLR
jgi:DNA repair protein RadC